MSIVENGDDGALHVPAEFVDGGKTSHRNTCSMFTAI